MRKTTFAILVGGLATMAGCKGKGAAPGAGSGSGSSAGATAAPSSGATTPSTAAGAEVKDLPVVTDCPKSLGGTEKVARTIKKECGPIAITSTLTVEGSLTLEAGVVLKFQPDSELVVGYSGPAKLIVKGGDAPDQRVVFTSGGDQAAGVWRGVALHDGADRSQITGLDLEYAGADGGAALTLRDAVDVTFTKSSIKHAKDVGLQLGHKAAFATFGGNTFDDIGKVAMSLEAAAVGKLGGENTFAKDAFIEIRGGHLDGDATWKNIGAPFRVTDTVHVDTVRAAVTLTIADATLAFATDAELAVGYASAGKLKVTGPATLTGIEAAPGSWPGVRVYGSGEATIDRATLSAAGTGEDFAGVSAKQGAKLTLGEVAFKGNKLGLWIGDKVSFSAPKPLTFEGNERAILIAPTAFGGLTGANVYAEGQIVAIAEGYLHADTTWLPQPKATVQVLGDIQFSGEHTLTIAAGGAYQWKADASLTVGYSSTSSLKVAGKADAPVTMTGMAGSDPWGGIRLESSARRIELSYLDLADVAGDAGITAKSGAVGKLDHVKCTRCAATVAPACGAKLESTAVTAGANTKVAEVKPKGC